ncbi:MAG: YHYH protein [Candidatus Nomurabacteria bacterium]|nr:MAG: YHYH protein [Candidatus Nomurabacteria bacterium]
MDPIQNIPQPDKDERPQADLSEGFWQKYRPVIITAALVLVAMIGGALTLFVLGSQPSARKNSYTSTPRTSISPTNTTSPSVAPQQTVAASDSWKSSVNSKALPLGDGKVSSVPKAGYVDSCMTNFRGGGARHAGSWINDAAGTWNSDSKVAVQGSIDWPSAQYSVVTSGASRIITTDDLPQNDPTGTFPISYSDPAYQYDTNPNRIQGQTVTLTLPLAPTAATTPYCVDLGYIGVMNNGVLLFNALDDAGRDAVAHETQDKCDGHPDGKERYHYHDVASCVRNRATGSSTLVGYALDGYGIYVERDSEGNLPTNADLDVCHGRTSEVLWNGKKTSIYHYDATLEYPYTIGCFHGKPVSIHRP